MMLVFIIIFFPVMKNTLIWAIWDTRFALLAVTKAITEKYKTEFSSVLFSIHGSGRFLPVEGDAG